MARHQLLIGGVEYPWSSLDYKRGYSLSPYRGKFEIPDYWPLAPDDTIEVKRNGVADWTGAVAKVRLRAKGHVSTIVEGFDPKRKLQLLEGVFTSPGTEANDHISAQFADTLLTEGTFDSFGGVTVDYGAGTEQRVDRRTAIDDILFMTGWELIMGPTGSCDFKSQCGADRSATLSVSAVEGTLLDWVEDYEVNGRFKASKVKVLGKGLGELQAYGSWTAAGYAAGDPERLINRKSLVSSYLCGLAASAKGADVVNPIKYGVAEVLDAYGVNVGIGDTVNVEDPRIGVSENLRVAEVGRLVTESEGERTTWTLTNISKLGANGDYLIGLLRSSEENDYARRVQTQISRNYATQGESGSGYGWGVSGTGGYTAQKDALTLSTGATAYSSITLNSGVSVLDASKRPYASCLFKVSNLTPGTLFEPFYHFGIGAAPNIGFEVTQGNLYLCVNAGAGYTRTLIQALTANTRYWASVVNVGDALEYYVDGVYKGRVASGYPTSGMYVQFYADAYNGDSAQDYRLVIEKWEVGTTWN